MKYLKLFEQLEEKSDSFNFVKISTDNIFTDQEIQDMVKDCENFIINYDGGETISVKKRNDKPFENIKIGRFLNFLTKNKLNGKQIETSVNNYISKYEIKNLNNVEKKIPPTIKKERVFDIESDPFGEENWGEEGYGGGGIVLNFKSDNKTGEIWHTIPIYPVYNFYYEPGHPPIINPMKENLTDDEKNIIKMHKYFVRIFENLTYRKELKGIIEFLEQEGFQFYRKTRYADCTNNILNFNNKEEIDLFLKKIKEFVEK